VIFQYRDGEYRLAPGLMRNPAPTEQELSDKAAGVRKDFNLDGPAEYNYAAAQEDSVWKAPPSLWAEMLDLIYSGNMKSAWQFLDLAWPADHPYKEQFLRDFKEKFATSRYYPEIVKMNSSR
jgi:hypothetical protein